MIEQFPIHATVAVSDLARARAWYEEKLGITPKIDADEGLWYEFAPGTWLLVYRTDSAGTARNTVAGWTVTGIEEVMADLRSRGVEFEEYDFGEVRTVDGLLSMGGAKAAWFKDGDGNTFELSEVPPPA